MRHTLVLAFIVANASISNAQSLAFEVASVKRNTSDEPAGGGISPPRGGRFQANNVTLRTLIRTAYDVENFQISGGPKWLDAEKFDVNAKGADGATWPETRMMIRELLSTRFKLSLTREKRAIPAYALIVGKNGPKLAPPTDPGCQPALLGACSGVRIANRKVLSGVNVSAAQLARVLTTFMGRARSLMRPGSPEFLTSKWISCSISPGQNNRKAWMTGRRNPVGPPYSRRCKSSLSSNSFRKKIL